MKLTITFLLIFSTLSFANTKPELKFILNNGDKIEQREIRVIQIASDRINNIEWLELKEGTLIDSTDIQSIRVGDSFENTLNLDQYILLFAAGDGSGG